MLSSCRVTSPTTYSRLNTEPGCSPALSLSARVLSSYVCVSDWSRTDDRRKFYPRPGGDRTMWRCWVAALGGTVHALWRVCCIPFVHATWPSQTGATWLDRSVPYLSAFGLLQFLVMIQFRAPTWLSPKWVGNPHAPYPYPLHEGLGGQGPIRPIAMINVPAHYSYHVGKCSVLEDLFL